MRKILKACLNFNLVLFLVAPSVAACTEEGISLSEVATNLDLGYLDNLKEETVLLAFSQKNPNVDIDLVSAGGGTSYKRYISSSPPWNRGYKNSRVAVTYKSKLGFGNADSNIFPILFTKKEQRFTIPIAILTDDYDESEEKDGPIVRTDLCEEFQVDYEIDKPNKVYNVLISLNPKINWNKNFVCGLILEWSDICLVEVKAAVDLKP